MQVPVGSPPHTTNDGGRLDGSETNAAGSARAGAPPRTMDMLGVFNFWLEKVSSENYGAASDIPAETGTGVLGAGPDQSAAALLKLIDAAASNPTWRCLEGL